MDVRDAAGDRILDRDHAEIGRAVLQGGERVLERRAGHRRQLGKIVDAGDMRIGPRLALVGDERALVIGLSFGASIVRARSRSSGVSTPSGAASTTMTSMRMPASSARNCSSFSRRSSGEGGVETKRLSASRR